MNVNSGGDTHTNTYPFITEGDGDGGSGIGTFGTVINGNDWTLKFYPDSSFAAQGLTLTSYNELFYRQYDTVNYDDEPLPYEGNQEQYFLDSYSAPLGQRADRLDFPITVSGHQSMRRALIQLSQSN